MKNSFAIAARKTTPSSTPMAAADVVVNLSTITEMISHAIPVSSNTHHRPAIRYRLAVPGISVLLSGLALSADWCSSRLPPQGSLKRAVAAGPAAARLRPNGMRRGRFPPGQGPATADGASFTRGLVARSRAAALLGQGLGRAKRHTTAGLAVPFPGYHPARPDPTRAGRTT